MPYTPRFRQFALKHGILFYLGAPCNYGHSGLRYTKGGRCTVCRSLHERSAENKRYKTTRRVQIKASKQKYDARNRERFQHYRRNKKYGITPDEFNHRLKQQKYRCAICNDPLDLAKNTHTDHKGERIRGILCNRCNTGLGQFRDSISNLTSAIRYLSHALYT